MKKLLEALIVLTVIAAVVAGIISMAYANGPEAQARAERIRVDSQNVAAQNSIQQQYDQTRADIMARAIAERDRQKLLDEQSLWLQGEKQKLELQYKLELQQIDNARLASLGDIVVRTIASAVLGVALVMGLATITSVARRRFGNWSVQVDPNKAYRIGNVFVLPGRTPGAWVAVRAVTLLDQIGWIIMGSLAVWRKQPIPARPGESIAGPVTSQEMAWDVIRQAQHTEQEALWANNKHASVAMAAAENPQRGAIAAPVLTALPFTAATAQIAGTQRSDLFDLAARNNLIIDGEVKRVEADHEP